MKANLGCGRKGGLLFLALSLLSSGGCLLPAQNTPADSLPPAPKAKELSPDAGAKACLTLAASMDKEGYEGEAIAQYERARSLDPHLRISRKLAVLYDRIGQQQLAQKEYQAALEQSPRNPDLLNNVGYFYYNWGKLPEAEEKLLAALALNPKHQRAWNNLGLVLAQEERYVDSLQAFQKVVPEAEAHSNLAFILTTQGKVTDARMEYQRALQLEPGLTRARLALDKLDHPGKAAPPVAQVDTARKAAQERLLMKTASPPTPALAVGPSATEQPILVTPPSMRSQEGQENH